MTDSHNDFMLLV